MLKKFYMLFRQNFMISLQFRAETFLWIFIDILPFILMIFIWRAIYAGNEMLQGYTLSEVIQFYLLIVILQRVAESHFENYRAQQIRDGKIDFYLVRPISYPLEILIAHISGKVLSIVLLTPAIILFLLMVNSLIPNFTFNIEPSSLLPFMILFILSFLGQYIIGLWIVYATFWLEGSQGLEHFKWITVAIFSGTLMPLAFLPDWLAAVINFLPFKYFYVVPIEVLRGGYTMQPADYLYALATVACMWVISQYMWRAAGRQYASAGG